MGNEQQRTGTDERSTAELAEAVGRRCQETGRKVAVAESLTSGAVASRLGAAPEAGDWFAGGVVAYSVDVKTKVLGVDPGPVVTAPCARQMARGVAELTGAGFTVSTTGVGGPDPEEGHPPGTVFLAVATPDSEKVVERHFDGDPAEVVEATTRAAVELLLEALG